jgi:alpha-glucosidase
MKSRSLLTVLCVIIIMGYGCSTSPVTTVGSPDGRLVVNVMLNDNSQPSYTVMLDNRTVVGPSSLGLVLSSGDMSSRMRPAGMSGIVPVDEKYTMIYGKQTECHYKANERRYDFVSAGNDTLEVIFRVSDDGVAFRYRLPGKAAGRYTVMDELSSFTFSNKTRAWLQPIDEARTGWCQANPSYEEHYMQDIPAGTPCPSRGGWAFPALFRSDSAWIAVSETAVDRNYCGSRLTEVAGTSTYRIRFPMKGESTDTTQSILPVITLPWQSPWRIMAISDNLKRLTESTLGTDLAEPSTLTDISWIKPGHASWSWAMLKDESIKYNIQKEFIDYASSMGWEYCLIDVNWNYTIGYEKIRELAAYAKTKNVGLILWYNSSGSWNSTTYEPKSMLLTHEQREAEFKKISEMGIKGIKVDFFAGDGQPVINYYIDIFEDAARYHLLVNCHGTTLPRGWERTYPNVLTMEAIKGFEFITFGQPDADAECNHACMLPFTRNLFDPMDFTPVCFTEIPGIHRVSTNGFELALSVMFLSGIQHYAETGAGMAKQPDYVIDFMKKLPVTWERSVFIDGYPGRYVVIARKSGKRWYLAAINGENSPRHLKLDLSLLGGVKPVMMISDGETNRSFSKIDFPGLNPSTFEYDMKGNGGFVMVMEENQDKR